MFNIRYAIRNLRNAPAFTAIAILTLALGIGANTAMFSVVRAVLLARLPYPHPDRIVQLSEQRKDGGMISVSGPNARDWRAMNHSLQTLAYYYAYNRNLSGGSEPQRIQAAMASQDFFRVLGAVPQIGRLTTASDHQIGAAPVAIIGHALWLRQFGGRSDVLGRTIHLEGSVFTVIGVMPPEFDFPNRSELWVPLEITPDPSTRSAHNFNVAARIKDGLSLRQVRADLDNVQARLAAAYIDDKDRGIAMVPLYEQIVGPVRLPILMLIAAVAFVLLIACVNIANLQLARGWSRVREMAVRTALGASRRRLAGQLLTESVLLSLAGGVAGLLLASWCMHLLRAMIPPNIPRVAHIEIDGTVLAYTLAISTLAGFLFGILPAFSASRTDVNESLKSGGTKSTMSRGQRRLGSGLVVAEISVAMILLAGAGLLIESFRNLEHVDPGFQTAGVITTDLAWPVEGSDQTERAATLSRTLLDRVRTVPGVVSAGYSLEFPLRGSMPDGGFEIAGRPLPANPHDVPDADYQVVTTGYFETLGIPLLRGRRFTEADERPGAAPVTLVNQSFAKEFFPGDETIGKRIRFMGFDEHPFFMEIIGIVADVRGQNLARPPVSAVLADLFQHPSALANPVLIFRAPWSDTAAVRGIIGSLDRTVPLEFVSGDQVIMQAVSRQRFQTTLLAIFAGLALLLAALGIYGVQSYGVNRRTSEMGIRLAVGATGSNLLGLVLREALGITLAGMAIGYVGALLLTRAIATLLFGIEAHDWSTYALTALLLGSVVAIASILPARRAARVDPTVALRYE
jgi:putative ABC transport system permease protein